MSAARLRMRLVHASHVHPHTVCHALHHCSSSCSDIRRYALTFTLFLNNEYTKYTHSHRSSKPSSLAEASERIRRWIWLFSAGWLLSFLLFSYLFIAGQNESMNPEFWVGDFSLSRFWTAEIFASGFWLGANVSV